MRWQTRAAKPGCGAYVGAGANVVIVNTRLGAATALALQGAEHIVANTERLLRQLDDRVKSTDVAPRILLEHFLVTFLTRDRP